MRSVPYNLVQSISVEFGAVECYWRESDVSFTGFVAEVWFESLPKDFAIKWASVVGYKVKIRCFKSHFAVSVPVVVD